MLLNSFVGSMVFQSVMAFVEPEFIVPSRKNIATKLDKLVSC